MGRGLQRPGPHRQFPGRPLRQLSPRTRSTPTPCSATPTATTRCGARSPSPACSRAPPGPHRRQPVVRPDRGRLSLRPRRASANAFVTPFARLQAYTGTQNGFSETGAQSLNLTVAQQTTNSLRSVIGAQLGGAMTSAGARSWRCSSGWAGATSMPTSARPVTATLRRRAAMPFTTFGVAPQRDGACWASRPTRRSPTATSIYLRYEGNISGQDSAHALTAGVRMTW